jgi:hypothetical protein
MWLGTLGTSWEGGGDMVPLNNPYHSKVAIETSHPILLHKPNDCPSPYSVEHIGTHCNDL